MASVFSYLYLCKSKNLCPGSEGESLLTTRHIQTLRTVEEIAQLLEFRADYFPLLTAK